MDRPKTQYAKSGDVNIAYQIVGEGPVDVVYVPGWASHLDALWDNPFSARFFKRVASFCRLIMLDKRGTGMSDRVPNDRLPTLEQRMEDVHAVLDAANSEEAVLFGMSEGGNMCCLFAATYPERTAGLALFSCFARYRDGGSFLSSLGLTTEEFTAVVEEKWAEGFPGLDIWAPSIAGNASAREEWARMMRMAASPGAAVGLWQMLPGIDITGILPSIRIPTVVMHRTGDRAIYVEAGRYLAKRIPEAKFVELEGDDHFPWIGDIAPVVNEIRELVQGSSAETTTDTVLTTVLFTDIVESTETAATMGDQAWGDLLEQHHATVRQELAHYRGIEVDTSGDGFFATFDGPARAIRCAKSISGSVRDLGIEVRAGLHTGECERKGDNLAGLAVHIGARVMSNAGAGEILVSGTVRDLVAGSGLTFADRGSHELKGVPGEWSLYAVEA